jgi:antirestriction protein ArdC
MSSQKQLREEITAKIIEALEKGVRPWSRPWSISPNSGRPMNFVSHRLYQGINPLLLELHSMRFGLRSKWWATFRQWSDVGCTVKKRPTNVEPGHWGASIILYRPFKKTVENDEGHQEEHEFMLMRSFVVFNADQVEGKIAERLQVHDEPASGIVVPDYGPAAELIAATGADIRFGGDRAYYCRPIPEGSWPNHTDGDYIMLPPKHRYVKSGCYYETLAHELCHWSELRTGWDHSKQGYAMGELCAEMAAAFLATELGVPQGEDLANHAAYLQSWLKEMKGDPAYIFRAATQASKAADYLLSFVKKEETVAVEAA